VKNNSRWGKLEPGLREEAGFFYTPVRSEFVIFTS
jgi:hypothetical protein